MSSRTATGNQTAPADTGPSQARQNLNYLGRRFRWPEGVADACATLQERYPRFSMYYAQPLLPKYGRTGYFARPRGQGPNPPLLYGATPAALETVVKDAISTGSGRSAATRSRA